MAENLFIASIVCFILSGAVMIVAVALFFSLQIQDTVKKLRGQSQLQWIMKGIPQPKGSPKRKNKKQTKAVPIPLPQETPTDLADEEESPTVLDDGEEKQISLVSAYAEDEPTAMEELTYSDESPTDAEETESEYTVPDSAEEERLTDVSAEETEEELTDVAEEDTEHPEESQHEFTIVETILYVHTDEVIEDTLL